MAQWQLSGRHTSVPVLGVMSVMTDKNFRMYIADFSCCVYDLILLPNNNYLLGTEVILKTTKSDFFKNKGCQNVTLIRRLCLYPR